MAAERGYRTTRRAFAGFEGWGFLGESEDGLFPVQAVERLIRAKQLAEEEYDLERRLILFRGSHPELGVPRQKLRDAMAKAAGHIRSPRRKMKRVHEAMLWLTDQLAGQPPGTTASNPPIGWDLPYEKQWKDMITHGGPDKPDEIDLDFFWNRVQVQYHIAALLLPAWAKPGSDHDLSDISFVDRVVLLTVRDLSIARRRLHEAVKQHGARLREEKAFLTQEELDLYYP